MQTNALVFHYVVRRPDTETPFGMQLAFGPTPDERGRVQAIHPSGLVSLKNREIEREEAAVAKMARFYLEYRLAPQSFHRLRTGDRVVEVNGHNNVDQMQIILFLHVTFTYETITSGRLLLSCRLITNDTYPKNNLDIPLVVSNA